MRTRSSSVPTTDDHFAMPRGLEIASGDGATLVPHISDTSSTYCGVFLARTEDLTVNHAKIGELGENDERNRVLVWQSSNGSKDTSTSRKESS